MLTWVIVGGNLPPVKIRAKTFSEALKKARCIDPNYCGGYVDEDE